MLLTMIAMFLVLSASEGHADHQTNEAEYWKTRPPRVGDTAPPFRFGAVLAPGTPGTSDVAAYSSERLRGRVVVLDFFATWCAPCVAAIPHMNELIRQTADLPVTYIAVGKEPAEVLTPVLKKHPMDSPFLHDADGSVSGAYWVSTLPHVVVVDRAGRITRIAHPSQLTRTTIEQAAAVRQTAPAAAAAYSSKTQIPSGDAQKPLASLTIHPTENRSGQVRQHQATGELLASGVDAVRLLRTAWNVMETQLEIRTALPGITYDLHIVPPGASQQAALAMLRSTLDGLFHTSSRLERRSVEGYRITVAPGASPLQPSSGSGRRTSRRDGRVEFENVPIEEIVRTLGRLLNRPVENATGLDGQYSLRLDWQGTGPEPVLAALRQAGFVIASGEIPLDVLVVEAASR